MTFSRTIWADLPLAAGRSLGSRKALVSAGWGRFGTPAPAGKTAVTPTCATNFADVHLHEGSGEPGGGRLTGDELLLGLREPEAEAGATAH